MWRRRAFASAPVALERSRWRRGGYARGARVSGTGCAGGGGLVTLHNELRTDTDLTRQLRSRLDADPRTRGLGKDSVVFQGTAELRGTATHDAQLVARKMAEAIDGVYDVANYVQLATPVQAADEKRAA